MYFCSDCAVCVRLLQQSSIRLSDLTRFLNAPQIHSATKRRPHGESPCRYPALSVPWLISMRAHPPCLLWVLSAWQCPRLCCPRRLALCVTVQVFCHTHTHTQCGERGAGPWKCHNARVALLKKATRGIRWPAPSLVLMLCGYTLRIHTYARWETC